MVMVELITRSGLWRMIDAMQVENDVARVEMDVTEAISMKIRDTL
jgi:hypothetical protein